MPINELSQKIADCCTRGGKVLICGNGGLAAESDHFAAELMGKYHRGIFIPAISLSSNGAVLTALANDYGYDSVFSLQVKYISMPEDLFIGMTTSASRNILNAFVDAPCQSVLINAEVVDGKDVADTQEKILKLIHQVAREAKDIIYELRTTKADNQTE